MPHPTTRDLELLGRGSPHVARLVAVFQEIAGTACIEDGLVFEADGITGVPFGEDARYTGGGVVLPCQLAGARVKVQGDSGPGDGNTSA